MATKRRMTNQELIEHLGLQNESHDNIRKMGFGGLLKGIGGIAGMIPGIGTAIGAGLNLAGGVADGIDQNKQQQAQQGAMEAQQNKQNAMQNFQQAQQPVKLRDGGSTDGNDYSPNMGSGGINSQYNSDQTKQSGESVRSGMLGNFASYGRLGKNYEATSQPKETKEPQYYGGELPEIEIKGDTRKPNEIRDVESTLGHRETTLQVPSREQTIDKPEDTGYEYWNDKGRTFRLRKGDDESNMEISKDGNKYFKVQSLRGGLMNIGSHGEDSRPKDKTKIPDETKPVIPHISDNGEIVGYKSSADSKVVYRRNPITGKVEVLSKKGKPVKEGGLREALILRKERGAIDESKEGELESIGIPVYKK